MNSLPNKDLEAVELLRSVCHSDPETKDGEFCITPDELNALIKKAERRAYEKAAKECHKFSVEPNNDWYNAGAYDCEYAIRKLAEE